MELPETLSEMMNQLSLQGYCIDLNTHQMMIHGDPTAFTVDSVYRFEGPTDPGDESILYAISSRKHIAHTGNDTLALQSIEAKAVAPLFVSIDLFDHPFSGGPQAGRICLNLRRAFISKAN